MAGFVHDLGKISREREQAAAITVFRGLLMARDRHAAIDELTLEYVELWEEYLPWVYECLRSGAPLFLPRFKLEILDRPDSQMERHE